MNCSDPEWRLELENINDLTHHRIDYIRLGRISHGGEKDSAPAIYDAFEIIFGWKQHVN